MDRLNRLPDTDFPARSRQTALSRSTEPSSRYPAADCSLNEPRVHRRKSVPDASRGVHPARRGSVRVLSGCGLERFRKGVFEESLSLFTTHAREPLEELLKRVPCLQVRYQTVHGNPRAGKHGHASHYFRIGVVYPPLIHRAIIYQPVRNLMSIDCFSTPSPRTTCRGGVCQPFRPDRVGDYRGGVFELSGVRVAAGPAELGHDAELWGAPVPGDGAAAGDVAWVALTDRPSWRMGPCPRARSHTGRAARGGCDPACGGRPTANCAYSCCVTPGRTETGPARPP